MTTIQDPITVVLATDSALIGDGLTALLGDVSEVQVVGRANDLDELINLVDELGPHAVIISVRSQVVTSMATVAAARRLRATHPGMGIVVISDRANGFALELLRDGSSGIAFLLDERLPGIGAVLGALQELQMGQSVLDPAIVDSLIRRGNTEGINDLTPREITVLEKMSRGLSNRAIADDLHVSVKAIEKGVTAIFLKLGPFDQGSSDRRVSAALVFLRAQTDPFGTDVDADSTAPIVVMGETPELMADKEPGVDEPED